MRLVRRDDPGFAEACYGRIFNGRKPEDRTPAAVACPRCDEDVVRAVRLANERGWGVSVRSGGHSWAGWSVRDDALLIDLGGMRDMTCDGETATARPAVKGGMELAPFLADRDRMFTGGHCESVGLGGFLLQGGQGWNSRRWGWGCENVLGVDVVTPEGELVHATEDHELYWAVRGAGPAFPGVVTRFYLRTYPLTPMWHDTRVFALDDLEPLLEFLHDVLPRLDVAVEPVLAATRLRTGEVELLLHTTLAWPERPDRLLAPLDAVPAEALAHERGPTTIAEENAAQARQNPVGHRYCADSQWTNASAAELAPLLRAMWSELPTRHSFSIWYGWAPTRELPAMAFSLEANVYLATYGIWEHAADDERHRRWVHGHMGRIASAVGEGLYVGDSDFTQRPDRYLADHSAARLAEIRRTHDPDGVFA